MPHRLKPIHVRRLNLIRSELNQFSGFFRFLQILSDSRIFQDFSEYFSIFSRIVPRIFQNIFQNFPRIFKGFFRIFFKFSPRLFKNVFRYFPGFSKKYFKIFIFQNLPRIFQDCSGFTRIYSDILQTFVKQVIFFSFFDIELETKRQGMKWIALNQWELIVIWERDANEKDAHGSRPYFSAATASCLIRFSN